MLRWWDKTRIKPRDQEGWGRSTGPWRNVGAVLGDAATTREEMCCVGEYQLSSRRTMRRISVEKLAQHFEALWNKAESRFMWKHVFSFNEKTRKDRFYHCKSVKLKSKYFIQSVCYQLANGQWNGEIKNIYLNNPALCGICSMLTLLSRPLHLTHHNMLSSLEKKTYLLLNYEVVNIEACL